MHKSIHSKVSRFVLDAVQEGRNAKRENLRDISIFDLLHPEFPELMKEKLEVSLPAFDGNFFGLRKSNVSFHPHFHEYLP